MATLVDTTEWREFRVGDLFDKCELKWHGDHEFSKALDVSDTPDDEFNLPLVNAKLGGNGIMFYGRESEWDSVKMSIDVVSNGASAVGSVYAQPQETGVLWDAYLVKCRDDIGTGTLQFLATVMESQIKQHFSYDNKCTWNKVKLLSINLPATLDGKPDWDYMERYMAHVMDEMRPVAEELHQLESTLSLHAVDVSKWKEFRVGELFDIRPTKNYGLKNSELFASEGDTRVVVNSAQNNGVGGYVGLAPTEHGNIVTFSDTTDANGIFIQDEPFVGYSHVQGMHCKDDGILFEALQFFATAFKAKALTMGFDYQNKFRRDVASEIVIKLLVTLDGNPDWDAMAEMMRGYTDSVRDVSHVIAELGR